MNLTSPGERFFQAILICFAASCLLFGCQKREIEKEIKNLKSTDYEVREAAVSALVAIGKPAVEGLVKSLDDENPSVQIAAAKALGKIGDSRAVAPLINLIKTSFDVDLMFEVAVALSNIGDDKACDMLREVEGKGNNFISKMVRKHLVESGFCKQNASSKKAPTP